MLELHNVVYYISDINLQANDWTHILTLKLYPLADFIMSIAVKKKY